MKIPVQVEISDQFLIDVISIAAEGGIKYWVEQARNVKHGGMHGLDYLSLEVRAEDETEWHLINTGVIGLGLTRICDGSVKIRDDIAQCITLAAAEGDASYIDADAADCIVQAGVFGKLIYG